MKGTNYDKVLLFIACTVTILWVITIVVQTIFPNHPTPSSVNTVMIIVAGGFFGGAAASNLTKKNGNGKGNAEEDT